MALFIPITKVDAERRLVYGTLSEEVRDKSDEILDYATAKPAFEKWSNEIKEASGGKSLGNVRAMHSAIAAGKLTDLKFDDDAKRIDGVAKIIDDAEWNKVVEGVYTGFSIGGGYARRWPDPNNSGVMRYTPTLAEVSIVDNPCVPTATFEYIKADGSVEMRKFTPSHKEDSMDPKALAAAKDALAKGTATDEQKALIAKADAELLKAAQDADAKGEATDEQKALLAKAAEDAVKVALVKDGKPVKPKSAPVQFNKWQAADGSLHDSKREAEVHNLHLEKQAELAPGLAEMDALLKAAKKPEDDDDEDKDGDSEDEKKAKKERREKKAAAKEKEEKEAAEKAEKERKEKEDAEKAAAAAALAKAKKKDDEPYGDVDYADPGYQKDKKKRYPLDTEDHIRAAWNYIHKKKNASKYSAEEADKIKAKIVAAWKDKIDKDGPPSAEDKSEKAAKLWKAFISGRVSKGMHDVSRMACFVDELQWFIQSVEFEEALEGDGNSMTPAEMKAILTQLCACLVNRVKEETEELLENHEDDDETLAMAASLPKRHAAVFAKMVGEMRPFDEKDLVKPEVKKAAQRFIALKDALEKAGARHSAEDKEHLMDIHKSACDHMEMVEKCLKAAGVMDDEPEEDGRGAQKISKALAELTAKNDEVLVMTKINADAGKALLDGVSLIKSLQKENSELAKRVEHLERQPAAPKGHGRAISKAQDSGGASGETEAEYKARFAKMTQPEKARELMKLSMSNPMELPNL